MQEGSRGGYKEGTGPPPPKKKKRKMLDFSKTQVEQEDGALQLLSLGYPSRSLPRRPML